jgi:DNA polymerase III delta subunit
LFYLFLIANLYLFGFGLIILKKNYHAKLEMIYYNKITKKKKIKKKVKIIAFYYVLLHFSKTDKKQ